MIYLWLNLKADATSAMEGVSEDDFLSAASAIFGEPKGGLDARLEKETQHIFDVCR